MYIHYTYTLVPTTLEHAVARRVIYYFQIDAPANEKRSAMRRPDSWKFFDLVQFQEIRSGCTQYNNILSASQ